MYRDTSVAHSPYAWMQIQATASSQRYSRAGPYDRTYYSSVHEVSSINNRARIIKNIFFVFMFTNADRHRVSSNLYDRLSIRPVKNNVVLHHHLLCHHCLFCTTIHHNFASQQHHDVQQYIVNSFHMYDFIYDQRYYIRVRRLGSSTAIRLSTIAGCSDRNRRQGVLRRPVFAPSHSIISSLGSLADHRHCTTPDRDRRLEYKAHFYWNVH